jgi:hypothetical protein
MGVEVEKELNVGSIRREQARILEFHREAAFLRSAVGGITSM